MIGSFKFSYLSYLITISKGKSRNNFYCNLIQRGLFSFIKISGVKKSHRAHYMVYLSKGYGFIFRYIRKDFCHHTI
jgi:hypothetical protein